MLKKNKRLTREQFNQIFSIGTHHHTPAIHLVYLKHPELKAAVVVPKKILKTAVERNRLRRRVYETIKECKKPGVFIFIMKQKAKEHTTKELDNQIVNLIAKAASA